MKRENPNGEFNKSEIQTREATADDLPIINKLNGREAENIEKMELQRQGKGKFLLLEKDGEIVGFSFICFEHSSYHFPGRDDLKGPFLEDGFVKEEYRRTGIGQIGLSRCEAIIKKNEGKKVITAVGLDNEASVAFHIKNGFKPIEDAKFEMPYKQNTQKKYGIYFVKDLEPD
ncbi:GNAT family N-acetyltransferase [Candidatus Parcubacteria bacterium]|nr:MAG: GNAT family N-acetyltransferase [Candidatus Parcubacteria bacterium]